MPIAVRVLLTLIWPLLTMLTGLPMPPEAAWPQQSNRQREPA